VFSQAEHDVELTHCLHSDEQSSHLFPVKPEPGIEAVAGGQPSIHFSSYKKCVLAHKLQDVELVHCPQFKEQASHLFPLEPEPGIGAVAEGHDSTH